MDDITEAKKITRVNSKGQKTRKVKCRKGFKVSGDSCVPVSGSEKVAKKKAIKKAVRSKKAKGAGFAKRTSKKRNKALKKRKAMGVK